MSYEEIKSSGITSSTPENIVLGAGTIHKGLTYGDVYTLTTVEPSDWATSYTNYFTKLGDVYSPVTGSEAPTWNADTYYSHATAWNFDESLMGATSGGCTITITPEFKDIDVDGKLVKVKGLDVKIGETATIEVNMVELRPDFLKMTVVGQEGNSAFDGYDVIESKPQVEEGDYIEHFGFIGRKLDGTPVIIIFDYALCTSGLSLSGTNKENGVFKATFECHAELSPQADTLPYHIYYPTPVQG